MSPAVMLHSHGGKTHGSKSDRQFVRAYKACERCRRTKGKCKITGDSNTCDKCVRERRECVFSEERSTKKRKTDEDDRQSPPKDINYAQTSEIQNSGFGQRTVPEEYIDPQGRSTDSQNAFKEQRTERPQNPRRNTGSLIDSAMVQTVVSSGRDALGLLFKAAEQQDTSDDSDGNCIDQPAFSHDTPESTLTSGAAPAPILPSALSMPSRKILETWNACRFVKQGWFSAREGVTYIDLFFRNLQSLTPIDVSFYADHKNHKQLISREPLLCCTLLCISSRYHVLPGCGGASRAHFIHTRLWKHCEHIIQRITFGQEKYSIAKSRTVGSIESLLLMTEWHPRALHFPPENDGWDSSLAPSIDDQYGSAQREEDAHLIRWREEVFEPAKRSDRMSWMLLGLATTLGHELGVFEDADTEDAHEPSPNDIINVRVRRLLFLYVNQLSLRLGCTTILPQNHCQAISFPSNSVRQSSALANEKEEIVGLWIEITKLHKTASEMFFPSKSATRQMLRSGRYVSLLEHFQPLLAQWHRSYTDLRGSDPLKASFQMLLVDYQYVRMYINSLAVQALVERASTRGGHYVASEVDRFKMENRQDHKFIQEVIDASRSILTTTTTLAGTAGLQFSPVRFFLRITSASIFLLKAISIGARHSEVQKSLDTLDCCIQALRSSALDDIHLSSRYGMLIERHVRRFRKNFRVQSAAGGRATGPQTPTAPIEGINTETRTASDLPQMTNNLTGASKDLETTTDFDFDFGVDMDAWLAQPFDESIAPFGIGVNQSASGLELNSLDFLWNLTT